MYDRLVTLNSIPWLLTTLGSGSLVLSGITALIGFIKGGVAGNILEVPFNQIDWNAWYVVLTFTTIAACIVIGTSLLVAAIWFRGKACPWLSEISLLMLLDKIEGEHLRQFLQQRIGVVQLLETFSFSVFVFLVLGFMGLYFQDGFQLKDIEFISLAMTLFILASGLLALSWVLLNSAVNSVKSCKNMSDQSKTDTQ